MSTDDGHGGDHIHHNGGDHDGGDHGDHGHTENPEKNGQSRLVTIATGIITLVLGLILVALIGWFANRFLSIGHLEDEIRRLNTLNDNKVDKSDLAHLRDKLDGKSDKTDVTHLRDRVADKADHKLFETVLADARMEIGGLRQSVLNLNSSLNNAIGKYEVVLDHRETEIANLRSHVEKLNVKSAKLEAEMASTVAELKQLNDVKAEKLTSEITMLRERVASLEATLKQLNSKKDEIK